MFQILMWNILTLEKKSKMGQKFYKTPNKTHTKKPQLNQQQKTSGLYATSLT